MRKINYRKMNKMAGNTLQALASMGIAFVVLGVIILASTLLFNMKSNLMLFVGLFFIVAGCVGYVYSLKKGR